MSVQHWPAGSGTTPRAPEPLRGTLRALVADLRGRGHHNVVDPLGRHGRVPAQHLAHHLYAQIVRASAPEDPLRACAAKRRADAVDVENLA